MSDRNIGQEDVIDNQGDPFTSPHVPTSPGVERSQTVDPNQPQTSSSPAENPRRGDPREVKFDAARFNSIVKNETEGGEAVPSLGVPSPEVPSLALTIRRGSSLGAPSPGVPSLGAPSLALTIRRVSSLGAPSSGARPWSLPFTRYTSQGIRLSRPLSSAPSPRIASNRHSSLRFVSAGSARSSWSRASGELWYTTHFTLLAQGKSVSLLSSEYGNFAAVNPILWKKNWCQVLEELSFLGSISRSLCEQDRSFRETANAFKLLHLLDILTRGFHSIAPHIDGIGVEPDEKENASSHLVKLCSKRLSCKRHMHYIYFQFYMSLKLRLALIPKCWADINGVDMQVPERIQEVCDIMEDLLFVSWARGRGSKPIDPARFFDQIAGLGKKDRSVILNKLAKVLLDFEVDLGY